MGRRHLFEIEDLPWFPQCIRSSMQDQLTFMGNLSTPAYKAFVAKLKNAMEGVGQRDLLDLCSGAGGPVRTILKLLHAQGLTARARVSDLFPNIAAYRRLEQESENMIHGVDYPVDATNVPPEFNGFRLLAN